MFPSAQEPHEWGSVQPQTRGRVSSGSRQDTAGTSMGLRPKAGKVLGIQDFSEDASADSGWSRCSPYTQAQGDPALGPTWASSGHLSVTGQGMCCLEPRPPVLGRTSGSWGPGIPGPNSPQTTSRACLGCLPRLISVRV